MTTEVQVLLGFIGAMGGFIAWFAKWLMNEQSRKIKENTEAVLANTTAVNRIADRFSEHMDKDEDLDAKLIESMAVISAGVQYLVGEERKP